MSTSTEHPREAPLEHLGSSSYTGIDNVPAMPPLTPQDLSRRSLLMKLGLVLNGLVVVAIATPIVRYLLFPLKGKDGYLTWISLGGVDEFEEGETKLVTYQNPFTHPWDGDTGKVAAYVRRNKGTDFTVFAINCAHLGCPVRWFAQSELFMCPCHGGVYYSNGDRAAGPPERGLFKYPVRVTDGKLMINAGQIPTLANQQAKLVKGITPCPGTNKPTIG
jgi:menaquinol-cytochrome c reductase iron-sulfur subunit